ncbi:MAG: RraA family protein [Phycisphaerae bacterium]|jgi:regulator of RNase E activity RraA
MTALPSSVLETLAQYDSPTVCNVIELCNCRPRNVGYLNHRIRAVYPHLPPMVGYAVTAAFRSSTAPAAGERSIGLLELVASWEAVPAPRVLVIQDLDDPPDGAVYGEIVATVARGFGCAGLVTNGYGRDVPQVAPLKFPCFAAGLCVSHSYCRLVSAGGPVDVGGVTIRPGDLLHGDANGVTTIPLEVAPRVADGCGDLVQAENVLIEAARKGPLTVEDMRPVMAEFMRRHDELARKLSGQAADRRMGV